MKAKGFSDFGFLLLSFGVIFELQKHNFIWRYFDWYLDPEVGRFEVGLGNSIF